MIRRFFTVLLLLINSYLYSQKIEDCNYLVDIFSDKMSKLDSLKVLSPNPRYYTKKQLFSVVVPEYVLYDNFTQYIEKIYMQYAKLMNHEAYMNTSIGPFQMTPQFIIHCIKNCSNILIDDELIIDIRKGNYDLFYENLNYFSTIENQWKILIYFEDIYWKESKGDINFLRRIYHSGESKSFVFTKINCFNADYEYWSDYFLGFY